MIVFENICKSYKENEILKNLSFEIEDGKIVVLIGESGSGKTTLLKMINRLVKPSSGKIIINGQDIEKVDVIELRRTIGYVIQQTGLFPHMTIKQNIEIIPKVQKVEKKVIEENTKKLMEMVGLTDESFLQRYPTQLSGGQQQRVGVARAFAANPEIILMDEPFSALDPITRNDLQDELIQLQNKLHKTIVFVTHDMDEAIKIADKIVIMKDGEIIQYDTPENILKNPINEFVAHFVGKNRIWSSPEFIKLSDIMIEKPVTGSSDLSILKCMEKMRSNKVDSLLIVEGRSKKMVGILKAKNIRNIEDKSKLAKEYMITDFFKMLPDENILTALKVVKESKISSIPIINEEGILKGLVTMSNLVTVLSQQYFEEDGEIE